MFSLFVQKVKNEVLGTSNLALSEIISINSISEKFAHELLLVTTYHVKYLFLYY